MVALTTTIAIDSAEFNDNRRQMQVLVNELQLKSDQLKQGGPEQGCEKRISKGKLLARDRIAIMLLYQFVVMPISISNLGIVPK